MFRFEFSAGPAIPLLELNTKQVVRFFELAIFYAGLTAVGFKFQRKKGVGCDRLLKFEARARWRDIFQNSPLASSGPEFRFPLHFDQICTKFSVFSSHD